MNILKYLLKLNLSLFLTSKCKVNLLVFNCSGLPFPCLGDLPNLGIKIRSPAL